MKQRNMSAIKVTGLHTYPFKSCAGLSLEEARLTPSGFEHDREFMVVDDDGDFVSQRKVPELALVVPMMADSSVTLAAPGMERVDIPFHIERDDEKLVIATVHEKPVAGQVVSEELNDWFTTFLPRYKQNNRFRLLHVRDDRPRYVSERYRRSDASNRVGFADGHPILLAAESSLARLNAEMDDAVPMNRFRPNIVINGEGLPAYDEDFWTRIRVGDVDAFVVKACDRCVVPDVDQDTAITGKAVRRALTTRRGVNAHDDSNTGVFFAQNLNHVYRPGLRVRLGDRVQVLERSTEANVVLRTGYALV
ncbi:MAG TPA: MOSC N-terminal beta barrel domain-containing protein [Solirubrobacteraceae bacterium]